MLRALSFSAALWFCSVFLLADDGLLSPTAEGTMRIATFNVSFNRPEDGQLASDLRKGDPQAKAIATVIRAVRPDVILLNEVDYAGGQDDVSDNAGLFEREYLAAQALDALGNEAWPLPHIYTAAVNTGVPSGLDINQNGQRDEPSDAWGFGRFPGQYGMAVLSRYPIDAAAVKSMQNFLWSKLPGATRPLNPDTKQPFYPDEIWGKLRLSSKSFWDVPVQTPFGTLHVLASHPTPPAFDGPEDYNGCRNHDEIRLIQRYIERASGLVDDSGNEAGLLPSDAFVVLGDLNSDPVDGDSQRQAIVDLIAHPRIAPSPTPTSGGGAAMSGLQKQANLKHSAAPENDTADFNDRSVGNLRVDYVLPSSNFEVVQSGVFWPTMEAVSPEKRQALKAALDASDHHLVWVDVRLQP